MSSIESVLGPIDTSDIGFTLMHEHLLVSPPGLYQDYPELLGPDLMERVVNSLKEAREGGVDTIVDATTLDLGRNIELLKNASRESGVNIIACSGWWLEIPRFLDGISSNQLAGCFIRELTKGISGTDVKAGILKAASDVDGVTPEEEVILRGVARAHVETGVPIILHSYAPGQVGREQLAILKEEGVNPARVKIDHSNDTTDVEYLLWLIEQGCYLGMDRYPGRNTSPLARTRTMKAIIDAGYADRLCPSHDAIILRPDISEAGKLASDEEAFLANPYGYLYMKRVVFQQLMEMGVSEEVIARLCREGPRNFFEGL